MKRNLSILLCLMVIVPLAVLGWLGVRLDASERAERERLIDQVLIEQLRNYDQTIANVVAKCADDVSKTLANAPLDGGDLRELQLNAPYVTQFFVLDANNALRYPTLQGDTLPGEEDFLLRTRDIWMNGELATQGAEEQLSQSRGNQVQQSSQKTSVSEASVSNASPIQRTSGWYVWHWGSDIHLIYWTRRLDGNVVGAEVNRARLTANIVAMLPQTGIDRALSEPTNDDGVPGSSVPYVRLGTRGELRNSRGEAIYIWLNRFNAENTRPRVSLPLSYPLSNWSLAFSVDPATLTQIGSGSLAFRLMARLGAVAIALIGLAVFFYRESARAMREAAQRVTFVNQVSHELKTPLTNIRMYAEMLDQNLDDADEQSKRQIGVLVSESQRLTRLIANILTFSRKERKGLSLRYTAGSIDACIESVIAQFRPALEAKGIELRTELRANTLVRRDADAIEQIVGNLIGNVEKYAANGKHLEIHSTLDMDTATIEIADAGPGIPVKFQHRIFDPFYRVSDKLTDGVAGTGIGLTIARELARLHGGDLVLLPSDRGARFRVTLHCPPLAKDETT